MRRISSRFLGSTALAVALFAAAPSWAAAQSPQPIVLGATTAQRREAARALVPLLKDVKAHARPGHGGARLGPQLAFHRHADDAVLFAISKRSVPVDPRVVAAMDRLLAWTINAPNQDANAALFDRWLVEMEARSSGSLRMKDSGLCDVNCVVTRMTTLDGTWGGAGKDRADLRDELQLEALKVAALQP